MLAGIGDRVEGGEKPKSKGPKSQVRRGAARGIRGRCAPRLFFRFGPLLFGPLAVWPPRQIGRPPPSTASGRWPLAARSLRQGGLPPAPRLPFFTRLCPEP